MQGALTEAVEHGPEKESARSGGASWRNRDVTPGRRSDDDTPTAGFIWQAVKQNDEKHEEGHARLRSELRMLEARLSGLESDRATTSLQFRAIEQALSRPFEVSSLRFTPIMVVSIVGVCLSVVGGWAATAMIAMQSSTQLSALTKSVDNMRGQQQMYDIKITNLEKAVIGLNKYERSQP